MVLTETKGLFVLYFSSQSLTKDIRGAKKGPEEDTCFWRKTTGREELEAFPKRAGSKREDLASVRTS